MTDIVERLREGVFGANETKTDAVIHSHMQAAADEIERLRAERDEAVATLARYRAENGCTRGQRTTQWCGEAASLQLEVARLQQESSAEKLKRRIAFRRTLSRENNHD